MGWTEGRLFGLALAAALAGLGCQDTEGGDTPTGELTPDFRVIANPSTTSVFARLTSETVPSVRLPDGDELRVTAGSQSKVMGYAVDPVNGAYYTSTLVPPALDQAVVFNLSRGGATDAPDSRVTMPAAIRVSSPVADTVVVAGSLLNVNWTPSGSGDEITIVLTTTACSGGSLTSPQGTAVAGDPGTATVAVPAALLPPDLPFGGTCQLSLRVERTRSGTPDPAFHSGGSVIARQIDFRTIYLIPEG